MTRASFRATALVALLALAAAACSSDDPPADDAVATTTSAVDTTTSSAAPGRQPPSIDWSDCGAGECAEVAVPLDHADPDGDQISIHVKRIPATGQRVGSLFFNFGGPGAGAADLIDRFPVPDPIRARFDLVAMDPRGVGASTPLACGIDPRTLYAVDHTIEDRVDAAALIDVSERYAEDCATAKGDLLPHLGTRNVARDMDLVRAGMGDDQLSYIGFSYGTSIGQAYAELFPARVRAMVLDGVVDPEPGGIAVAVEQAQGFETALQNWADGCAARGSCRFGDGAGAISAVEDVLALAEDGVASSDRQRALGPGEVSIALAYPLYQELLWPSLDLALAEAIDGDGRRMVALADDYTELVDFSIYFAVSCLDSTWPRDTDTFLEAAEDAATVAPHFGEAIVNDYIRCAVWPVDPDPVGAVDASDAASILVVSTTGDPATPYENGVRVAQRLDSGVLLTYQGEGHTIAFQGSGCVDAIVNVYLIDLEPPTDGARC